MITKKEIYKVGDRVYDSFNGFGWGYSLRYKFKSLFSVSS